MPHMVRFSFPLNCLPPPISQTTQILPQNPLFSCWPCLAKFCCHLNEDVFQMLFSRYYDYCNRNHHMPFNATVLLFVSRCMRFNETLLIVPADWKHTRDFTQARHSIVNQRDAQSTLPHSATWGSTFAHTLGRSHSGEHFHYHTTSFNPPLVEDKRTVILIHIHIQLFQSFLMFDCLQKYIFRVQIKTLLLILSFTLFWELHFG